ncbi:MAG: CoA transferase [Rhodocyclaceae bacterium]|nr:CoA transferase [Rhodocyclaceae bacterium]MBX3668138.1 CoA transferase [Rhodocyclaceae bacterium]
MDKTVTHKQRQGPLAGIKVLEFAGIGPGPFCGMLLADMGAEVTLLERGGGTFASQMFGGGRKAVANRGKKSVCVDLKHPASKELVNRMIGAVDVLIEGYRPGVMERLGFGPDACLAINPRLVYGRMTGWGQTGPLAQRAGHDANYAGIAGALDSGRHRGGPPWVPPTLLADMGGGGLLLAWGIACALFEAQRSGQGQVIDASMCEGAALLAHGLFNLQALGAWDGRCVLDSSAPFYEVYACADGLWLSVCPLEPQFYAIFLERLGLAGDAEFAGRQYDTARWPGMKQKLTDIFVSQDRAFWIELFADTDACVWPVLSMEEAPRHAHNVARQSFVDLGGIVQPAPAPKFSRTPGQIHTEPPLLGEHSAEQLMALGLARGEVEQLLAAGVIMPPRPVC